MTPANQWMSLSGLFDESFLLTPQRAVQDAAKLWLLWRRYLAERTESRGSRVETSPSAVQIRSLHTDGCKITRDLLFTNLTSNSITRTRTRTRTHTNHTVRWIEWRLSSFWSMNLNLSNQTHHFNQNEGGHLRSNTELKQTFTITKATRGGRTWVEFYYLAHLRSSHAMWFP